MLTLKRLAVWFVETSLEVLLLGLALIALFGHDQHAFGRSLVAYATGIVLLSFTTGYLLTTAVARGAWRGRQWWSYSAIAVALFLIHSQVFFVVSGGSTRPEKLSMQIAGACIVFACTFAGTLALRRWTAASSKLAEPQP
jgi:peptidoglycan/LPS O-acetylase OafA/YrhL